MNPNEFLALVLKQQAAGISISRIALDLLDARNYVKRLIAIPPALRGEKETK